MDDDEKWKLKREIDLMDLTIDVWVKVRERYFGKSNKITKEQLVEADRKVSKLLNLKNKRYNKRTKEGR